MRKTTMIAAAAAAVVLGTGAVVSPVVLAANDDQAPQGPGVGYGYGRHHEVRGGAGGMHAGMRFGRGADGDCPVYGTKSGTLTREQKQRLAGQAVLEKLSHDVYVVFATDTGDRRFQQIASSETRHLQMVRTLMDRYDVADPTRTWDLGEFSGGAKDTYNRYVENGSTSLQAALSTARNIEKKDIAGLTKASEGLDAPDAEQVYEHLTHASQMHLAAFSG